MKVFDLEAAKRGEPIRTRDGQPVKFIAHVPNADECNQIVVLIGGEIICFYENGTHAGVYETAMDLFMAPRKRTVWVNLYPHQSSMYAYSKKIADEAHERIALDRIGNQAWPVEIEE